MYNGDYINIFEIVLYYISTFTVIITYYCLYCISQLLLSPVSAPDVVREFVHTKPAYVMKHLQQLLCRDQRLMIVLYVKKDNKITY